MTFGSQSGCSRFFGKFVAVERKVLQDNFYFLRIFLEHLFEYRHKPCTVLSLKVVEDGNHNRCIIRSLIWGAGYIDVLDKIENNDLYGFVFVAVEDE